MYEPGKILYVGGGPPTNTAEIIDLNQPSPAWAFTGSMAFARRQMNATVCPPARCWLPAERAVVASTTLWAPSTLPKCGIPPLGSDDDG